MSFEDDITYEEDDESDRPDIDFDHIYNADEPIKEEPEVE